VLILYCPVLPTKTQKNTVKPGFSQQNPPGPGNTVKPGFSQQNPPGPGNTIKPGFYANPDSKLLNLEAGM